MNTAMIKNICREYTEAAVSSVRPLGDGHINETFLAGTDEGFLVVQCIQRDMDTGRLEHNYRTYSTVCQKANWLYPQWLKRRDGSYFYRDECGDCWRVYPYHEAEILSPPLTKELLYACGQGLARTHAILQTLPNAPLAVFPKLHDLPNYHREYQKLLSAQSLREDARDPSAELLIQKGAGHFLSLPAEKTAVVHGDPKLDNLLFRDGKMLGFIDADTIMSGSLTEDLADCMRSCCILNGSFHKEQALHLLAGYLDTPFPQIPPDIENRWEDAFRKICFELGLRYYTDSISGRDLFHEKYPGYRLQRARTLLSLSCE